MDLAGNAFSMYALTPSLIVLFGSIDFKWPEREPQPEISFAPSVPLMLPEPSVVLSSGAGSSHGSQLG